MCWLFLFLVIFQMFGASLCQLLVVVSVVLIIFLRDFASVNCTSYLSVLGHFTIVCHHFVVLIYHFLSFSVFDRFLVYLLYLNISFVVIF